MRFAVSRSMWLCKYFNLWECLGSEGGYSSWDTSGASFLPVEVDNNVSSLSVDLFKRQRSHCAPHSKCLLEYVPHFALTHLPGETDNPIGHTRYEYLHPVNPYRHPKNNIWRLTESVRTHHLSRFLRWCTWWHHWWCHRGCTTVISYTWIRCKLDAANWRPYLSRCFRTLPGEGGTLVCSCVH